MSATRKVVLKYLGLGAVAIPVAGLGLVAATGPGTLARQREAARRDGLPLLPEDLKHTPPVPDEQNAAPLLRELARLWDTKPVRARNAWDKTAGDFNRYPEDPKLRAAFAAEMEKYPDLSHLAEEAAKRPHGDFASGGNLVRDVFFSDRSATSALARFFAARSALASTPAAAFGEVTRIMRLADLLREIPTPEDARRCMGLQALADRAYLTALRRFGSSRPARESLDAFGPPPDPEFYSRGDVVESLLTIRLLRDGKLRPTKEQEESGEGSWALHSDVAPLLGAYWEEQVITFWREFFSILRETRGDDDARQNCLKALEARWKKTRRLPQNWVVARILPFPHGEEGWPTRARAARALRETALSLLEAPAKRGACPEPPTLPIDPYSGRPLGYRREGAGCVLWSVGPDGKDDDGVALSAEKRVLDLVVRLP